MVHERLRDIRIACGVSQVAMAKGLNVSRQTYLDIESGKTEPRIGTVKAMADILDCCPCYLAFGHVPELPKDIIKAIAKLNSMVADK